MSQVMTIVGHGKSVEGKGWGRLIDNCDFVLRMWDNQWQDPVDHGIKYDYGFLEIGDELIKTFWEHKKRDPRFGWVASLLGFTKLNLPEPIEIISQLPWTFIGKRMGGLGATGNLELTRGAIATIWAAHQLKSHDTIVCVGFDNVVKGKTLTVNEGFSRKYRANQGSFTFRGYKENAVRYGNHDFSIERRLMQYFADRRGVKLLFTGQEWPHELNAGEVIENRVGVG